MLSLWLLPFLGFCGTWTGTFYIQCIFVAGLRFVENPTVTETTVTESFIIRKKAYELINNIFDGKWVQRYCKCNNTGNTCIDAGK